MDIQCKMHVMRCRMSQQKACRLRILPKEGSKNVILKVDLN